MSEYIKSTRRQQRLIIIAITISVIFGLFLPYKNLFLGFSLGGLTSLYNHWLLQRKIADLGEAVSRGEKPKGLGVLSRIAASATGTMIALLMPAVFHMIAFLIGLVLSYVVMYVDFVWNHFQNQKKEGEADESHSSDC